MLISFCERCDGQTANHKINWVSGKCSYRAIDVVALDFLDDRAQLVFVSCGVVCVCGSAKAIGHHALLFCYCEGAAGSSTLKHFTL